MQHVLGLFLQFASVQGHFPLHCLRSARAGSIVWSADGINCFFGKAPAIHEVRAGGIAFHLEALVDEVHEGVFRNADAIDRSLLMRSARARIVKASSLASFGTQTRSFVVDEVRAGGIAFPLEARC